MCFRKLLSKMFGNDDKAMPQEVKPEEDPSPATAVPVEPETPKEPEEQPVAREDKPVVFVDVPNPMREVEYHFSLADRIENEEVVAVSVGDDTGDLVFDAAEKALTGKPQTSRDFWMEIETSDKIYRIDCYINENPRLLWNDIPSDQVVKLDKDYQALLSPQLDVVAVSHRGRSHAHRGTYRDDDFFIGRVGEFTLSIVADGAGSAQLSSTGSKVFCQKAGAYLTELLEAKGDALLQLLSRIQQAPDESTRNPELLGSLYEILPATALFGLKSLKTLAADNGMPLKQYHTTALISLTVQVSPDCYFCAAFQIGDGMTAVLAGQRLELLGEADAGNYPGETVFVTSPTVFDDANQLLKRIRYCFCSEKPVVISMTDGITDSYFESNSALDDINLWHQLLAEVSDEKGHLKPASEICDWLNYYIDKSHDDRTMSIVVYK